MTTPDDSGTHATIADSGDNTNSQELPRGSNLGRYVIIAPIGSGGMGTVYRAYDPQLNRGVALKILSVKHENCQAAEKAKARLIREAQALAQLSHPNVVAVHDAGTFENDVYIAMELVEGKTLDEWLKGEKRPVKEVLEIMTAAGRGLSAAHNAGLIHRDFKPGNVMVGDDGRVRVLDFGLARVPAAGKPTKDRTSTPVPASESADNLLWGTKTESVQFENDVSLNSTPNLLLSPLTDPGGVIGTPLYMAPEQHLGQAIDERSDQFSYCLVLYEALYSKLPFAAKKMRELRNQVIAARFHPSPTDTVVPEWLWKVVAKGLSASPHDRYPTIDELLATLAHDPEEERRRRAKARRIKLLVTGLALLALALPLLVWYRVRFSAVLECRETTASDATQAWNAQVKSEIEKSFLATKASYADDTWALVHNTLDRYIKSWRQERSALCSSARRAEYAPALFDLKMKCLKKRLIEFRELTSIFKSADIDLLQTAAQAASRLSSLAHCLDEQSLRSRVEPPHESIEARVAELRESLLLVMTLDRIGKYEDGLQLAREVLGDAQEVGYVPLVAESLSWVGSMSSRNGNYTKAEQILKDAYVKALASVHYEVIARSSMKLVWDTGFHQSRFEEGLFWIEIARAAIDVINNPSDLMFSWYSALGALYSLEGKSDLALDNERQALEIAEVTPGPQFAMAKGKVLSNIGVTLGRREQYDEALAYFQRALKIGQEFLGRAHPEIARRLTNIGLVYELQGDHERATESQQRALAIWEDALGKDHPLVTWPLSSLGDLALKQGDHQEALAQFSRIREICQKVTCDPAPEGKAYFGLARVAAAGGDQHGLELAERARTLFSKRQSLQRARDEVDAWLKEQAF